MTTMDVASELKLAQLRKQNLRKTFQEVESHSSSILFLALQWKDIESHFDSIQKSISKRQDQLVSLEESLRKRLEEVKSLQESVNGRFGEMESREANEKLVFEERAKELAFMRVSVEERSREVEMVKRMVEEGLNALDLKEKRFGMLEKSTLERSNELEAVQQSIKESFREIELKESRLGLVEESVEERVKVIELREKRIEEWSKEIKLEEKQFVKEVELKEKMLQQRSVEVEWKEKMVKHRAEVLDSKEIRFEEWAKAMDTKEKTLEVRHGEVEWKEKMVKECAEELELKEMSFEECVKAFDLKEKRLEERFVEIKSKEEKFKERAEKLELKEKSFEECAKGINLKGKILEERSMEIESKDKGLVEPSREIELKENILEQHSKEVELEEKQVEQCSEGVETNDKGFAENFHYDAMNEVFETLAGNYTIDNLTCNNVQLSKSINGKSLLMFLNEHYKEHDLMLDEVLTTLRVSSDPGKLVLDAVQGFYPLDAENEIPSIELSAVRKSCILLLEGLVRISPVIELNVKDEAMKLAFDWITKMRPEAENHMEILGFLLLLAAYGLAFAFDDDELMTHLLVVAWDRQAPELCRILGLVDKISDFICNLISERKDLGAIRLVYAFKLVGKLQPVNLIKTYMRKSRRASIINCRIGGNSRAAQIKALNKRIADVKAVMRCIEEHNLESEYSPKNLQNFIVELNKKKATLLRTSSTLASEPHVSLLTPARSSRPTPNNGQQQSRMKRPRTVVSATGAPNACPGANSCNHSMQFPHQQSSNFYVDQEIKLTRLKKFQMKNPEGCNLSFEQLMIGGPKMKARRRGAAMKLAANMKVKLDAKIENPVDVLCFLQLIATYELASSFDAHELLGLFEYIYRRKQAPKLYLALGLADKIPKFIKNLLAEEKWLDAIGYISAFGLKDKLPLVPLLKNYLSYSKKVAEQICEKYDNSPNSQIRAINKELSASVSALKRIAKHNLESEYPPEIIENRIEQLEKEKQDILNVFNFNDGSGHVSRYNSELVQQNSGEKHIPPTTAVAATKALTPSPAPAPDAQPLRLSGNKRPRTLEFAETSEDDFVGAITTIPSEQKPPQPNASLHDNHGSQNVTGHYSFGGFPPMNQHIGSYPNVPISYYPRDAINPRHFNRSVAYGGPSQKLIQPVYYNHQVSYGGYGDGYRGPDYHSGQTPSGGYGLRP